MNKIIQLQVTEYELKIIKHSLEYASKKDSPLNYYITEGCKKMLQTIYDQGEIQ